MAEHTGFLAVLLAKSIEAGKVGLAVDTEDMERMKEQLSTFMPQDGACQHFYLPGCGVAVYPGTAQVEASESLVVAFRGDLENYAYLIKKYVLEEVKGGFGEDVSLNDIKDAAPVTCAQLLALLYEKLGVGLLPKLRGAFVFLCYDVKKVRLLAARSPTASSLSLTLEEASLDGGNLVLTSGSEPPQPPCSSVRAVGEGEFKYGVSGEPRKYASPAEEVQRTAALAAEAAKKALLGIVQPNPLEVYQQRRSSDFRRASFESRRASLDSRRSGESRRSHERRSRSGSLEGRGPSMEGRRSVESVRSGRGSMEGFQPFSAQDSHRTAAQRRSLDHLQRRSMEQLQRRASLELQQQRRSGEHRSSGEYKSSGEQRRSGERERRSSGEIRRSGDRRGASAEFDSVGGSPHVSDAQEGVHSHPIDLPHHHNHHHHHHLAGAGGPAGSSCSRATNTTPLAALPGALSAPEFHPQQHHQHHHHHHSHSPLQPITEQAAPSEAGTEAEPESPPAAVETAAIAGPSRAVVGPAAAEGGLKELAPDALARYQPPAVKRPAVFGAGRGGFAGRGIPKAAAVVGAALQMLMGTSSGAKEDGEAEEGKEAAKPVVQLTEEVLASREASEATMGVPAEDEPDEAEGIPEEPSAESEALLSPSRTSIDMHPRPSTDTLPRPSTDTLPPDGQGRSKGKTRRGKRAGRRVSLQHQHAAAAAAAAAGALVAQGPAVAGPPRLSLDSQLNKANSSRADLVTWWRTNSDGPPPFRRSPSANSDSSGLSGKASVHSGGGNSHSSSRSTATGGSHGSASNGTHASHSLAHSHSGGSSSASGYHPHASSHPSAHLHNGGAPQHPQHHPHPGQTRGQQLHSMLAGRNGGTGGAGSSLGGASSSEYGTAASMSNGAGSGSTSNGGVAVPHNRHHAHAHAAANATHGISPHSLADSSYSSSSYHSNGSSSNALPRSRMPPQQQRSPPPCSDPFNSDNEAEPSSSKPAAVADPPRGRAMQRDVHSIASRFITAKPRLTGPAAQSSAATAASGPPSSAECRCPEGAHICGKVNDVPVVWEQRLSEEQQRRSVEEKRRSVEEKRQSGEQQQQQQPQGVAPSARDLGGAKEGDMGGARESSGLNGTGAAAKAVRPLLGIRDLGGARDGDMGGARESSGLNGTGAAAKAVRPLLLDTRTSRVDTMVVSARPGSADQEQLDGPAPGPGSPTRSEAARPTNSSTGDQSDSTADALAAAASAASSSMGATSGNSSDSSGGRGKGKGSSAGLGPDSATQLEEGARPAVRTSSSEELSDSAAGDTGIPSGTSSRPNSIDGSASGSGDVGEEAGVVAGDADEGLAQALQSHAMEEPPAIAAMVGVDAAKAAAEQKLPKELLESLTAEQRADPATMQVLSSFDFGAAMPVCVSDDDHRMLYVNSEFERATGLSSAEVVGEQSRLLQGGSLGQEPGPDGAPSSRAIQDALKDGRGIEVRLHNWHGAGEAVAAVVAAAAAGSGRAGVIGGALAGAAKDAAAVGSGGPATGNE